LKEFIMSKPAGTNSKQGSIYSIHPEKHLEVKMIIEKKHRYRAIAENDDFDSG
jgi:hypothetical protein